MEKELFEALPMTKQKAILDGKGIFSKTSLVTSGLIFGVSLLSAIVTSVM